MAPTRRRGGAKRRASAPRSILEGEFRPRPHRRPPRASRFAQWLLQGAALSGRRLGVAARSRHGDRPQPFRCARLRPWDSRLRGHQHDALAGRRSGRWRHHARSLGGSNMFLGIDLGTSSLKALVLDVDGSIVGTGSASHPLTTPQPGRAESDPQAWWQATRPALRGATGGPAPEVAAGGPCRPKPGRRVTRRAGAAPPAAAHLGIRANLPVVGGAADTAAAALAGGLLDPGPVQLTIGSGAQVVAPRDRLAIDSTGRTHLYRAAAPDRWYAMAAMQNAGIALEWVRATLGATWDEVYAEAFAVPAGAQGLLFPPDPTR